MFLGIDQSLRSTGLAVIASAGNQALALTAIQPKKLTGAARLQYLRDGVRDVLTGHTKPHYACLEGYSLHSVNRSFDLGEVGGVLRLCLYDAGIPFTVVPPTTLKKFASGKGTADKDAMRRAVNDRWSIDIPQDDACDAYALAHVARLLFTRAPTTRIDAEVLKTLTAERKAVPRYAAPRTHDI